MRTLRLNKTYRGYQITFDGVYRSLELDVLAKKLTDLKHYIDVYISSHPTADDKHHRRILDIDNGRDNYE